ncbi:MAG TPA: hypothetical protein VLS89_12630, partial [Candidatus Nanopelagicales bacterium]|nr:hypothetical protein [Candidatus Nanopelagicales bacterium]
MNARTTPRDAAGRAALALIVLAAAGCNDLLGTEEGELAQPAALASPARGQVVAGPQVELSWSGGAEPYEVDLAFDPDFDDLVPGLSLRWTSSTSVVVDGLYGGLFHWRVRCAHCGPGGGSESRELRVTCAPRRLAEGALPGSAAIAWNDVDGEYGIAFTRGDPPELVFLRTDRLGNVISGPSTITNPDGTPTLEPGADVGTPGLAYVKSRDRWVIAVRRGDTGEIVLARVDDGGVTRDDLGFGTGVKVLGGSRGERHEIRYDLSTEQVITFSEVQGSPQIDLFDSDLTKYQHDIRGGWAPGSTIS